VITVLTIDRRAGNVCLRVLRTPSRASRMRRARESRGRSRSACKCKCNVSLTPPRRRTVFAHGCAQPDGPSACCHPDGPLPPLESNSFLLCSHLAPASQNERAMVTLHDEISRLSQSIDAIVDPGNSSAEVSTPAAAQVARRGGSEDDASDRSSVPKMSPPSAMPQPASADAYEPFRGEGRAPVARPSSEIVAGKSLEQPEEPPAPAVSSAMPLVSMPLCAKEGQQGLGRPLALAQGSPPASAPSQPSAVRVAPIGGEIGSDGIGGSARAGGGEVLGEVLSESSPEAPLVSRGLFPPSPIPAEEASFSLSTAPLQEVQQVALTSTAPSSGKADAALRSGSGSASRRHSAPRSVPSRFVSSNGRQRGRQAPASAGGASHLTH
jgi:hypothetical protein